MRTQRATTSPGGGNRRSGTWTCSHPNVVFHKVLPFKDYKTRDSSSRCRTKWAPLKPTLPRSIVTKPCTTTMGNHCLWLFTRESFQGTLGWSGPSPPLGQAPPLTVTRPRHRECPGDRPMLCEDAADKCWKELIREKPKTFESPLSAFPDESLNQHTLTNRGQDSRYKNAAKSSGFSCASNPGTTMPALRVSQG